MVRIGKNVIIQMLQSPSVPPECGGILGQEDEVITRVVPDFGKRVENTGTYIPNTEVLNQSIAQWQRDGIEFAGIYHTHASHWPELSKDDLKYIDRIMKAMPHRVNELLFPLVFPQDHIRWYAARREQEVINIVEIEVEIV